MPDFTEPMENDSTEEIKQYNPNLRFGTSFLDIKYRNRAVDDETMMDKRTGEIIWKRNTDGKLVCFTQENMHLGNYIQQMKILLTRWGEQMIRPAYDNCKQLENMYFIASNISVLDFAFDNSDENKSVLLGSPLYNPNPDPFSIALQQNGFFVNLTCAPRDRALVSFLTSLYDNTYRNYDGPIELYQDRQAMYGISGYDHSQVLMRYTITYYRPDGDVYNTVESTGYLRLNELTWVPFQKTDIYDGTLVGYAKVTIDSIECPKLAVAINDLISDDVKTKIFAQFKENADVTFQTLQISAYTLSSDPNFALPTPLNTHTILCMSWHEYETELLRADAVDKKLHLSVSIDEPSSVEWEGLCGWFEINRLVLNDGSTESTGSETNIDELEKNFGAIAYHSGRFTENVEDTEDYYINEFNKNNTDSSE